MIEWDVFLRWAKDNFGEVETSHDEIKVNSIFVEDTKLHLWCNPRKNAYHCWKSDKSGNLFDLVSKVSKCSYQEAVGLLSYDNELRLLEERLDKFFADKQKEIPKKQSIAFPPDTYSICKLPQNNYFRRQAEEYLRSRKLSPDSLYVCVSGEYRNRIIIPYYDNSGKLIYWNGRDFTGKAKSKYRGPDVKLTGIGKADVLFIEKWPSSGTKLHLAEGEFDAMSLTKSGLYGAACGGKSLDDKQIEILRMYQVCICFDTDKSGADALNKMGDKLIGNGIKVTYVRPPVGIKDWNQMFVTLGAEMVKTYIIDQEREFTLWTSNALRVNR